MNNAQRRERQNQVDNFNNLSIQFVKSSVNPTEYIDGYRTPDLESKLNQRSHVKPIV